MRKNINTVFIAILVLASCKVYPMPIFVKSYIDNVSDRTYTLEVEPTDDILNVRSKLATRTGYPLSAHYQLFFGNTLLADEYTLGDYNIVNESSLKLYLNSSELPVELISFTANVSKEIVVLKWQTATEVNNYGFEIERKRINGNWNKIGFVEGSGNSNSPKSYSFIDKNVTSGKYSYRLKQIDTDGSYEYSNEIEVTIKTTDKFALKQNYPNPFNPSTKIEYSIPYSENVLIKVYDVLGREVKILLDEYKTSGTYEIEFDANELTSGLYFYKIISGNKTETRKMMLIR